MLDHLVENVLGIALRAPVQPALVMMLRSNFHHAEHPLPRQPRALIEFAPLRWQIFFAAVKVTSGSISALGGI